MDNDKIYDKLPLSIADQIDRLKGLGLHFEDEQNAAKILSEVSYFRFVAYLRPLEADKISHRMKPNATFEKGLAMYPKIPLSNHTDCQQAESWVTTS